MRIQIESIVKITSGTTMVAFECAAGLGKGRWAPYASEPQIRLSYNVELNVDDPIISEETSVESIPKNPPCISVLQDKTILHLSIEGKDTDGLLYGRLAPDCIIMLEHDDTAIIDVGDFISIIVPSENILLSPF
jgi:hypothetical protein